MSRLTSVLTAVRGVNKTDALTMSSVLGPLSAVMSARPEELSACPGLGPTKVSRESELQHGYCWCCSWAVNQHGWLNGRCGVPNFQHVSR